MKLFFVIIFIFTVKFKGYFIFMKIYLFKFKILLFNIVGREAGSPSYPSSGSTDSGIPCDRYARNHKDFYIGGIRNHIFSPEPSDFATFSWPFYDPLTDIKDYLYIILSDYENVSREEKVTFRIMMFTYIQ